MMQPNPNPSPQSWTCEWMPWGHIHDTFLIILKIKIPNLIFIFVGLFHSCKHEIKQLSEQER